MNQKSTSEIFSSRRNFNELFRKYCTRKQAYSLGRFRGNTFLDAGYVFAPYVPLTLTPVIEK